MWLFIIGGILTLLSGYRWDRETAVVFGVVFTLGFLVLGWEFTTSVPIDSPLMFFPEEEKRWIQRKETQQIHRTLRFGAGVLVALALLFVAGY